MPNTLRFEQLIGGRQGISKRATLTAPVLTCSSVKCRLQYPIGKQNMSSKRLCHHERFKPHIFIRVLKIDETFSQSSFLNRCFLRMFFTEKNYQLPWFSMGLSTEKLFSLPVGTVMRSISAKHSGDPEQAPNSVKNWPPPRRWASASLVASDRLSMAWCLTSCLEMQHACVYTYIYTHTWYVWNCVNKSVYICKQCCC